MRILVFTAALAAIVSLNASVSAATLDLGANLVSDSAVVAACPTALAFSLDVGTTIQPLGNVEMDVQPIESNGTERVSFVNRKTNQIATLAMRVRTGGESGYNMASENISYNPAKHLWCILPNSTK